MLTTEWCAPVVIFISVLPVSGKDHSWEVYVCFRLGEITEVSSMSIE